VRVLWPSCATYDCLSTTCKVNSTNKDQLEACRQLYRSTSLMEISTSGVNPTQHAASKVPAQLSLTLPPPLTPVFHILFSSARSSVEYISLNDMSSALPPVPPSLGIGSRRKGSKTLPKLPLSVFTPPPSGSSDKFPLAPSPSTIHPAKVIDAHVVAPGGDLSKWQQETSQALGGKLAGAVVSLCGTEPSQIEAAIES
jgi:hypothetical protein